MWRHPAFVIRLSVLALMRISNEKSSGYMCYTVSPKSHHHCGKFIICKNFIYTNFAILVRFQEHDRPITLIFLRVEIVGSCEHTK